MLLFSVHLYTTFKSFWSCDFSAVLSVLCPILVSSAKLDKKADASSLSISPMRQRNSRGPSTDPCGTPERTGEGDERFPLTLIVCVLPVMKEWIHLPRLPLTLREWSFLSKISKSTLSKALAKSKYKVSTSCPSSMSCSMCS